MSGAAAPVVLLDLDGTLTDSYPGIASSVRAAYAALGLPVPDDATLRRFVGPPLGDSFAAHGVPAARVAAAVEAYRVAFRAGGMWDNSVYAGVPAQLTALRTAGVRLAVATSKPEVFAVPICERLGLAASVEHVVGAPLDAPSTKAEVVADALARLADAAAVDRSRTLMLGDRHHDVTGARAHGIDCVGVGWGYGDEDELRGAGAVEVVRDVACLAQRLLRRLGVPAVAPPDP
ncbi:HAD hydrolase-like protein [Cellulomonas sp. 179-A 9B4 NHS]|uniref:HAD hydrolase-like protein n=1 Tax=Cellulomonas sp. 179-A 9B4 NHS TaxID=3142379 RepID=UPI0039A323E2